MILRGIEFSPVIETPDQSRGGRSVVRWGAGVILYERECPKLVFSHFFDHANTKRKGLFICFSDLKNGDPEQLVNIVHKLLEDAAVQNTPVVVALSIFISPAIAVRIAEHPQCDAVMTLDEIPWKDFPQEARTVFFRTVLSPFGGESGNVSGKYVFPLAVEWIRQCRREGMQKPIIAGGGVLRVRDIDALAHAGASGIAISGAKKLRPWNVWRIVWEAQRKLSIKY